MSHEILADPRRDSRSVAEARPLFGVSLERVGLFWSPFWTPKQTKRPDFSGLILVGLTGFEPVLPP